ncbi:hypothetical protein G7B40_028220 [Aetokthonos hydrillicola Thurmond2011]|jgi:hypothetical protein|uniref:Uncharacterized protein n=1 Tax=Aetokthonos hydrillicola Thurmond2011 TaxID=2712845 RepID=A0AAP5IBA7_9CYAN|nr:hypothetical protein [Aetokthonos hydrillicola]MBO3462459.1 hypothetical protein [Aetokthonos hydrillicola CCALA 1050]MBW4589847.1 hypothetical protein [Aetokthonos hydrillicola CCALA 1050]MDR9898417.1 hypothetical protein [Aetokthonos hydrillicola Thurmond2011]
MKYTFDIVGVSPVLQFFNHQCDSLQASQPFGVEYIGTDKCTLDSFIKSVEPIPIKWGWDLDEIVRTVIQFWMNNSESIGYWKLRLNDAGNENLLVGRIADIKALKTEFELLLEQNW